MGHAVKTRALRLAAHMLGGPKKLRDRLRASSADVAAWMSGEREPPAQAVLKAVDLILDDLDAGAPRLRRLRQPLR